MKSVQRRFNAVAKNNPMWSSLVCFSEAVKNQKFTPAMMRRWFYKLVDKCDYERKDKKVLLQGLDGLLKTTQHDKNRG